MILPVQLNFAVCECLKLPVPRAENLPPDAPGQHSIFQSAGIECSLLKKNLKGGKIIQCQIQCSQISGNTKNRYHNHKLKLIYSWMNLKMYPLLQARPYFMI